MNTARSKIELDLTPRATNSLDNIEEPSRPKTRCEETSQSLAGPQTKRDKIAAPK
eukprot:CAMPEP_0204234892 /NCGR_PEP_ID=MMETSP0361-20130328/91288_1 /ASSEMBLY_ACC=CAM_ASM_000343 /TAXON_ID=268821 /ORGANISM="Scrippsiella Hangoei, Strain SHTV-5" /LENGTH=54 /DNA_ID=CAMNT_0051206061 /DNA_START=132 /DNA_END=293 /DNA_ORIENTATION=+